MTLEFHSLRDVQILCRLSLSLSHSFLQVRMEYLASLLLPAALACVRRAGEVAVMRVLPSTLFPPSLQANSTLEIEASLCCVATSGGREGGSWANKSLFVARGATSSSASCNDPNKVNNCTSAWRLSGGRWCSPVRGALK